MPTWSKEIRRWQLTGSADTMVVELQDFDGHQIISLRRWYRNHEGALLPGKSGLPIPVGDLSEVARTLEIIHVKLDSGKKTLSTLRANPQEKETGAEVQNDEVATAPVPIAAGQVSAAAPNRPRPPLRGFGMRPPVAAPLPVPAVTIPRLTPLLTAPGAAEHRPPPRILDLPPAPPPPPAAPVLEDTPGVTLKAIIAKGLVQAPLPLIIETRNGRQSGVAYADGTLAFGNRLFSTPKEAVMKLKNYPNVIDGWSQIRFLNPQTRRYAKMSKLRNRYLGLSESAGDTDD